MRPPNWTILTWCSSIDCTEPGCTTRWCKQPSEGPPQDARPSPTAPQSRAGWASPHQVGLEHLVIRSSVSRASSSPGAPPPPLPPNAAPPLPLAFLLCAGLPGSVLVPLQLERAGEEATLLDYAMRTSRGAVYLQCSGALHARLLAKEEAMHSLHRQADFPAAVGAARLSIQRVCLEVRRS